jgi:hypothetical protein
MNSHRDPEILELGNFLEYLLEHEHIAPGTAAAGITRQVIEQGERSLTEQQRTVFERYVVRQYLEEQCGRCGGDIPYGELESALDNGGFCDWCADMMAKDD